MFAYRYASWTAWSQWSTCSVTCTEGVRQRNRACYGIGRCHDPRLLGKIQTEPCEEISCCPGMEMARRIQFSTKLYGQRFVDT